MSTYIKLSHFAVQQRLAEHCKSTVLNKKFEEQYLILQNVSNDKESHYIRLITLRNWHKVVFHFLLYLTFTLC